MMNQNAPQRLYLMQVGDMPQYQIPIVCYLVQTGDGKNILIDSGLPEVIPEDASDFENGQDVIELDKFHTPEAIRTGAEKAPVNELGIRRIMFAVDDIDDVVVRLLAHGAELVGEVVQYGDTYRLAYIRGPEGIMVGLAEQLEK